jgi:hypothetical protein
MSCMTHSIHVGPPVERPIEVAWLLADAIATA